MQKRAYEKYKHACKHVSYWRIFGLKKKTFWNKDLDFDVL